MSRSDSSVHTAQRLRLPVFGLFFALVVEQALDLHSTLTASATQHEGNKAVNWLALHLGFAPAIVLVKLAVLGVVFFLFRTWRRSNGSHDREFAVSLCLVVVTYAAVIGNNYVTNLG